MKQQKLKKKNLAMSYTHNLYILMPLYKSLCLKSEAWLALPYPMGPDHGQRPARNPSMSPFTHPCPSEGPLWAPYLDVEVFVDCVKTFITANMLHDGFSEQHQQ